MSKASQGFRVWVSRRWWPWPKRYDCLSATIGGTLAEAQEAEGQETGRLVPVEGVPDAMLFLHLADNRKVFVDMRGRTVTYGAEVFDQQIERRNQRAARHLPLAGKN
jgi:hypothetical protein